MSRIRTIKPDFWTDEKLTECSLSARLLFIGTFNFADDNGNLPASAKKLKMQIFPADNIDCEPLLNELITHGMLIEYSVNGEKYLNIKGFKKHQVINRPSKSSIPTLPLTEKSPNTHGVLNDGREGKGMEGKGINTLVPNDVGDDCPHQEIINLYHKHLPMLTQVKSWTAKRSTALKTRWREDTKRQSLDWWAKLFNYISKSDFLTGKASEWQADLEWIINSSNLVKIIEGKYENKQAVTA
jgi:hypothetical protein